VSDLAASQMLKSLFSKNKKITINRPLAPQFFMIQKGLKKPTLEISGGLEISVKAAEFLSESPAIPVQDLTKICTR